MAIGEDAIGNYAFQIEVDKIGSATSPLKLSRTLTIVPTNGKAKAGDVVVVRVLTDNATYNMLELPTGRLAKVNPGDVLVGVLGRRRALSAHTSLVRLRKRSASGCRSGQRSACRARSRPICR